MLWGEEQNKSYFLIICGSSHNPLLKYLQQSNWHFLYLQLFCSKFSDSFHHSFIKPSNDIQSYRLHHQNIIWERGYTLVAVDDPAFQAELLNSDYIFSQKKNQPRIHFIYPPKHFHLHRKETGHPWDWNTSCAFF